MERFIMAFIVAVFFTFTIKFKIVKNENEANVDLFFSRLLNIRFDVDEFYVRFTQSRERPDGFSVNETMENIRKLLESRSFFSDILSYTVIKEIRIIDNVKIQDSYYRQFVDVLGWTTLSMIQRFVRNNFKAVMKEEYKVVENFRANTFRISIYCIGEIKLVNIIISIFKNIRQIPQLLKRVS
ncbi:hypothetical protein RJG79_10115 [Mycoplasmatota bacterium WC44]